MSKRRKRGSWPGTESERGDRGRVIRLVKRVGGARLCFTVYDLRREMADTPTLKLEHSDELWRHLQDLEGDVIVEVGRRFDHGVPREGAEDVPTYARKKYVLRERYCELEDGAGPPLDDLERVYWAVWVAYETLEREIPTRAVTSVLRNVKALHLTTERNTSTHLQTLHRRNHRLVEKSRIEGSRWVRWSPLGTRPARPEFEKWKEEYLENKSKADLVGAKGMATLNECARELLRIAIRESDSTTYPDGRPVTIQDIRRVAGSHDRAKELVAVIRRRSSLGNVLGDASKSRVDGRDRVDQRVVRLVAPYTNQTFYDVPDEQGFERRRQIPRLWDLRTRMDDYRLGLLEKIERQARHLSKSYPGAGLELEAVVSVRRCLLFRELDQLHEVLEDVEDVAGAFSRGVRDELERRRRRLSDLRQRWYASNTPGAEEKHCCELLDQFGLTLEQVSSEPRSLISAYEYAEWFDERSLNGHTPPVLLSFATSLRRFENPDHTSKTDDDKRKACVYLVDRAEAMAYAAERVHSRAAPRINAAARLLGRNLRCPELVACLLQSGDRKLRIDALFALALLDDSRAVKVARKILDGNAPTNDEIVSALQVLVIQNALEPKSLPHAVKHTSDRRVRQALRDAMIAHQQGRRLLPG